MLSLTLEHLATHQKRIPMTNDLMHVSKAHFFVTIKKWGPFLPPTIASIASRRHRNSAGGSMSKDSSTRCPTTQTMNHRLVMIQWWNKKEWRAWLWNDEASEILLHLPTSSSATRKARWFPLSFVLLPLIPPIKVHFQKRKAPYHLVLKSNCGWWNRHKWMAAVHNGKW